MTSNSGAAAALTELCERIDGWLTNSRSNIEIDMNFQIEYLHRRVSIILTALDWICHPIRDRLLGSATHTLDLSQLLCGEW